VKVVILAGGLGTRISEETDNKPKPMVEIGGKPILWHIMKIYAAFGFNEFIICLGYKGYVIKEFFANYCLHNSDFFVDLENNALKMYQNLSEPWKIHLIDTGLHTMTGGRLKRVKDYIGNEEFMFTYGDGISNINLQELLSFHRQHGKLATITAVRPPGRFGALKLNQNNVVEEFLEKPAGDGNYINGGFFVLSHKVLDYISNDEAVWEKSPLEQLAKEGNLISYQHHGFWHAMDVLRDKIQLEKLWNSGAPPWKIWT